MKYSKIQTALESVLPGAVYKVQAPEKTEDGTPLTRYLVWTPTGVRSVTADGVPFATVGLCVVTVATQQEDDTLTAEVLQALADAHIAIGQSEQSFDQETMTYYSDIPCEVI